MQAAPPFVGRLEELAHLDAHLAQARDGHGGVVALVGEAGIGKSALAQTFASRTAAKGAVVARGHCYEAEWSSPFAPWAAAAGELVRAIGAEEVKSALGPAAEVVGRLVPALASPSPTAPPLTSSDERFRVYDAVTQLFLGASTRAPVLLVIEDLHWADGDSLGLLQHAARMLGEARCLVVVTYRDAEIDAHALLVRALAALHRDARFVRIDVPRFSPSELAEVVGGAAPTAVVDAIWRETGGNPLYVRELWRHLVEERRVDALGSESADEAIVSLGVPHGIREVVRQRLLRLSPAVAGMLRVASAFSGVFQLDVLTKVTDLDEVAAMDALDEARRAGFVEPRGTRGYELTHAIVRRTIYDDVNVDRQARLHRKIATVLEELRGDRAAAELVAQYHASIGLPGAERGGAFARVAAKEATLAAAHDRAVRLLRMGRALAETDDLRTRADIACALALAETDALLPDEARRSAETAADLLGQAGAPDGEVAAFLEKIATAIKDAGAPPMVWEPLALRALAKLEGRDAVWARLVLLRERYADVATGPIHVGRWLGLDPEAVTVARASGDEATFVMALSPFEPRTRDETNELLDRAAKWKTPRAILRALDIAQRDMYHRHADCRTALSLLERMLDLAERVGAFPAQAEALYGIAKCRAILGDLAAAQETARRVPPMIARLGTAHRLQTITHVAMNTVLGYFAGTDWPEIVRLSVGFVERPAARRTPLGLVVAGFAALGMAMSGARNEATAWIAQLLPITLRSVPTMYNYKAAVDLVCAATWHIEAAQFAPALLALQRATIPELGGLPSSCVELERARMATLVGEAKEARASFDAARRVLEDRGHRAPRAIVDFDEALALARLGVKGRAHRDALLHASLAAFESLGMHPWAERARERLAGRAARVLPDGLTQREAEVLRLVALGQSNKEIARGLFLSVATVQRHIANIYHKIQVNGRADATRYALRHGLAET